MEENQVTANTTTGKKNLNFLEKAAHTRETIAHFLPALTVTVAAGQSICSLTPCQVEYRGFPVIRQKVGRERKGPS